MFILSEFRTFFFSSLRCIFIVLNANFLISITSLALLFSHAWFPFTCSQGISSLWYALVLCSQYGVLQGSLCCLWFKYLSYPSSTSFKRQSSFLHSFLKVSTAIVMLLDLLFCVFPESKNTMVTIIRSYFLKNKCYFYLRSVQNLYIINILLFCLSGQAFWTPCSFSVLSLAWAIVFHSLTSFHESLNTSLASCYILLAKGRVIK